MNEIETTQSTMQERVSIAISSSDIEQLRILKADLEKEVNRLQKYEDLIDPTKKSGTATPEMIAAFENTFGNPGERQKLADYKGLLEQVNQALSSEKVFRTEVANPEGLVDQLWAMRKENDDLKVQLAQLKIQIQGFLTYPGNQAFSAETRPDVIVEATSSVSEDGTAADSKKAAAHDAKVVGEPGVSEATAQTLTVKPDAAVSVDEETAEISRDNVIPFMDRDDKPKAPVVPALSPKLSEAPVSPAEDSGETRPMAAIKPESVKSPDIVDFPDPDFPLDFDDEVEGVSTELSREVTMKETKRFYQKWGIAVFLKNLLERVPRSRRKKSEKATAEAKVEKKPAAEETPEKILTEKFGETLTELRSRAIYGPRLANALDPVMLNGMAEYDKLDQKDQNRLRSWHSFAEAVDKNMNLERANTGVDTLEFGALQIWFENLSPDGQKNVREYFKTILIPRLRDYLPGAAIPTQPVASEKADAEVKPNADPDIILDF